MRNWLLRLLSMLPGRFAVISKAKEIHLYLVQNTSEEAVSYGVLTIIIEIYISM